MVKASESQIDNLVALLDGYAQEGGHHLNVNVFSKETLLDAQALSLIHISYVRPVWSRYSGHTPRWR